jgi:hypothetical protein
MCLFAEDRKSLWGGWQDCDSNTLREGLLVMNGSMLLTAAAASTAAIMIVRL